MYDIDEIYTEEREYTRDDSYLVDEIEDYNYLFIRDGERVFFVDKNSGEVVDEFTLTEYVTKWREERVNNPSFISHYEKGLFIPRQNPDDAQNIKELKRLCSDSTRHRKGDTGYLLDFIIQDVCNKTESKLFLHIIKNIIVWNYATVHLEDLPSITGVKTPKQVKAIWKSMQDKGLMKVVNDGFKGENGYCSLVKVHPKMYWEGRYSAWAAKCKADYEYEDGVTVTTSDS